MTDHTVHVSLGRQLQLTPYYVVSAYSWQQRVTKGRMQLTDGQHCHLAQGSTDRQEAAD